MITVYTHTPKQGIYQQYSDPKLILYISSLVVNMSVLLQLFCYMLYLSSSLRSFDFLLLWWWFSNVPVSTLTEDWEDISSHGVCSAVLGSTDLLVKNFREQWFFMCYSLKANVGKRKKDSKMVCRSEQSSFSKGPFHWFLSSQSQGSL